MQFGTTNTKCKPKGKVDEGVSNLNFFYHQVLRITIGLNREIL